MKRITIELDDTHYSLLQVLTCGPYPSPEKAGTAVLSNRAQQITIEFEGHRFSSVTAVPDLTPERLESIFFRPLER